MFAFVMGEEEERGSREIPSTERHDKHRRGAKYCAYIPSPRRPSRPRPPPPHLTVFSARRHPNPCPRDYQIQGRAAFIYTDIHTTAAASTSTTASRLAGACVTYYSGIALSPLSNLSLQSPSLSSIYYRLHSDSDSYDLKYKYLRIRLDTPETRMPTFLPSFPLTPRPRLPIPFSLAWTTGGTACVERWERSAHGLFHNLLQYK
jgi:hypothetical protein